MSYSCPHCNASDARGRSQVQAGRVFRCVRCGGLLRATAAGVVEPAESQSDRLEAEGIKTVVDNRPPAFDDADPLQDTQVVFRPGFVNRPASPDRGAPHGDDHPARPGVAYRLDDRGVAEHGSAAERRANEHTPPPVGSVRGDDVAGERPAARESSADGGRRGAKQYVAMPMPAELDAGFDDAVTGILSAGDLHKRLQQMRADRAAEGEAETAPAADSAARPPGGYPAQPSSQALAQGLRGLSLPAKLGVAALLLALCAGAAITTFVVWRNAARVAYVTEARPLLAGPGPEAEVGLVGTLGRGELVTVYARVGEYAVVTDGLGRAGYVVRAALARTRPEALPELPFAGCRRALLEATPEPCRDRADRQAVACRSFCEREAVTPDCFDDCRARLAECQRGCQDEAPHPAGEPAVQPSALGVRAPVAPTDSAVAAPRRQPPAEPTGREPAGRGAPGDVPADGIVRGADGAEMSEAYDVAEDATKSKTEKQRRTRKRLRLDDDTEQALE